MIYTDLKIDGYLLEFHKDLTGKETLFLNGNIVSVNKSPLGGKHLFNINCKTYTLKSRFKLFKILLVLSEKGTIVRNEETDVPSIHVFYLIFIPMMVILILMM